MVAIEGRSQEEWVELANMLALAPRRRRERDPVPFLLDMARDALRAAIRRPEGPRRYRDAFVERNHLDLSLRFAVRFEAPTETRYWAIDYREIADHDQRALQSYIDHFPRACERIYYDLVLEWQHERVAQAQRAAMLYGVGFIETMARETEQLTGVSPAMLGVNTDADFIAGEQSTAAQITMMNTRMTREAARMISIDPAAGIDATVIGTVQNGAVLTVEMIRDLYQQAAELYNGRGYIEYGGGRLGGQNLREETRERPGEWLGERNIYGRASDPEADARGLKLLKEWLSPAQFAQYDAHKHFEVIGCDTGRRYRIRHGRSMNIDELDRDGRKVAGWCFVPQGGLVPGDVMLAQKVALETNERGAMKVANLVGGPGFGMHPALANRNALARAR